MNTRLPAPTVVVSIVASCLFSAAAPDTADAAAVYMSLTDDKRIEFFDASGTLLGDAGINLPVSGSDFNDIAVGDVDASNPGLELVVLRDNVVDIFTMPTPGGPAVNRLKFNNLGTFGNRENLSAQTVD